MDKVPHNTGLGQLEQQHQIDSSSAKELIDQLIGILRRQYPIIVLISGCVIAMSLVYLFTTPKQYTAHAMFLIDTTKMQVLQQQQQVTGELPLDTAQVDTQIEVMKSAKIGLSVVKDLKLIDDPEFVGSQTGILGAIFNFISSPFSSRVAGSNSTASENALTQRALGRFLGHRDIKRVARTYVLDLSYTSLSPGTAATVANAIGDAYLVDQLDSKYQASRRASKWLQERIAELRQQAMAADSAVLEFKEQKKIFSVGGSNSGDGRLLADQRVVDLNSQLANARAATAEAKARLDNIEVVIKQEIPDAAVADSLSNSIISALRTQYLELDRRYHLFAARYGPTHLAVINLQTQMTQLRRSMADELGRIAESYKSNYEIAQSREASLEKSLANQISGAQLTNRERLGLDELESKAKAYHSIHDSFLQRYMEITQQQSLPITEARVITSATPPGAASSPRTSRILLMAVSLGLMASFAAAFLRESVDRVFRTTKQVETILRTNCLAVLPIIKNVIAPASGSRATQSSASKRIASTMEIDQNLPGLFRHVINDPLSSFAEGFRSVKVAADISGSIKQNKVIGITSSLPHEGKSTVASNFAEIIAHGGSKVILIDGDLRNPTLSRRLISKADVGLLQVIGGKVELDEAIYTDHASGLAFLPTVIESRLAHSSEIVGSEAFRQLIERLRKTYDYIIIDFPPLAPVVDVRATTNIIDSYVFVVEWGRTRLNMVQRQLNSAPEIFDRLLGVVLNKANVKILDRYEDYYGRYYYKKNYYARYGYTK
jgi:succinoglycan biosynthesis transport protein ExoP